MKLETVAARSLPVLDLAVGIGAGPAIVGAHVARSVGKVLAPVVPVGRAVLRPALVDERFWPETALRRVADRGREHRLAATRTLAQTARALVPQVFDAALDEIDLTQTVRERVDLDDVARGIDLDAAVARVDIDAILDRVDLIALARFIIDGVDLPEIIRESTGSMASEGIRGVRIQTIDADERVNRLVDRVLLRRQARRTELPGEASSAADGHKVP